jgi:hypothetical protein
MNGWAVTRGALALAGVMGDALGETPPVTGQPQFAAKAQRAIHLFLNGGRPRSMC